MFFHNRSNCCWLRSCINRSYKQINARDFHFPIDLKVYLHKTYEACQNVISLHPMMQANFMILICRDTQVDKSINFHHHTLIYLLSQHTTVDNVICMQYNKQCSVCNCLQQRSFLCSNNAHATACHVSSALLHNVSFIYFYIFISGIGVGIFSFNASIWKLLLFFVQREPAL